MDSRNSKQTSLEPVDSAPQDETELHTTRMPAAGQTKPGKRKKNPKRGAQHPRSIFKPRTKNPNFLLSVLVSTVRLSTLLVLCAGLALFGALVGIAKAYVDPAKGQRKEEVIGLVELDAAAIGSERRPLFRAASQYRFEHEVRAGRAKGQVGVRIDVRHVKRRAQAAIRKASLPEVQRLVVRIEDCAGQRMLPAQPALLLEKAHHLIVRIGLGAAFVRPLAKPGERTRIRQEKIHVQIQYFHRTTSQMVPAL